MPFVTKSGGLCFDDGVVLTHKDENKQVIKGNGLLPKFLTNISSVGLDPESEEFRLAVIRGTPRPNGTSWETSPVFIIQHYDFDKATWERFLAKFERLLTSGRPPTFSYEPAVYDITDLEYGRREMPLWVIKRLDNLGVFASALEETKVESRAKKLTQAQYNLIRKAIDNRIALEEPVEEPLETPKVATDVKVVNEGKSAIPKKQVLVSSGVKINGYDLS